MNNKMYEKMLTDIKKILNELSPKNTALSGANFDKHSQEGLELLKGAGEAVNELPSSDMEEIGGIVAHFWHDWIAEKESKGLPGKKVVADFYNILKGMGVKKPFHAYNTST